MKKFLLSLCIWLVAIASQAQDNPDLGSWYMYFGNFRWKESPWAIHGEVQYRNHNILGDLEQLLLRTGLQYNLQDGSASFTLGYGNITSQPAGDSDLSIGESRIYQEAILRQKVYRVGLMHRFRYEQRWVDSSPFRTRFRYAIFVNVPLNSKELNEKGSWYIQVYDEIFINGETLDGLVEYFDRNRIYLGLGRRINPKLALQVGFMEQKTNRISKNQLQFSVFYQLYNR